MKKSVYIGYDSPYPQAFAVAARSVIQSMGYCTPSRCVHGLRLQALVEAGLYTRGVQVDSFGQLFDPISQAPMSTEFAISRFLTPTLHGPEGLALFMDCDMLIRGQIIEAFGIAAKDRSKAVWVVKHQLDNSGEARKMDNRIQTSYARKNWSSFMIFNCEHPKVRALTPERVNAMRGLELHQFQWLDDDEIGELSERWNWLVGVRPEPEDVANVHWTLGGPWLEEFGDAPYAREWNDILTDWVGTPQIV